MMLRRYDVGERLTILACDYHARRTEELIDAYVATVPGPVTVTASTTYDQDCPQCVAAAQSPCPETLWGKAKRWLTRILLRN